MLCLDCQIYTFSYNKKAILLWKNTCKERLTNNCQWCVLLHCQACTSIALCHGNREINSTFFLAKALKKRGARKAAKHQALEPLLCVLCESSRLCESSFQKIFEN